MSSDEWRLGYGADASELVMEHIERYYSSKPSEPRTIQSGPYEGRYETPRRYCVYVLRCEGYDSNAYGTGEKLKNDWEFWTYDDDRYDTYDPPKWVWAAYYSDSLYYVGYTSNPYERMIDHAEDSEKSSIFCGMFAPLEIVEMRWYRTEDQAEMFEVKVANEYRQRDSAFVYQA